MGKTFCVFTNGNLFDEYKGKTSEAAINAYMEELSAFEVDTKKLLAAVRAAAGVEVELSAFEVDTKKLLAAVQAAAGVEVLQDGRGVAVVDGVRYQNYQVLAKTFGLSIEAFFI